MNAPIGRLVLVGITSIAAVAGFVAFPGCATPRTLPADEFNPQRESYHSALRNIEKKKRRGELAGLEPAAAGTFSGTWLWYDNTATHQHQIRFDFKYSDGRPDKRFQMNYSDGWQIVPISKQ